MNIFEKMDRKDLKEIEENMNNDGAKWYEYISLYISIVYWPLMILGLCALGLLSYYEVPKIISAGIVVAIWIIATVGQLIACNLGDKYGIKLEGI